MKEKRTKSSLSLNPFVLIAAVVLVCGILGFVITPGVLEDGIYTALPRNELNFNNIFNIVRAIPYGIKESANIMILILVVGGALEIYKRSGAIDNAINSMVNKFGGKSHLALLVILIVVFSALGGFMGWIEVLVPFVPLVVAVVLALGYDSLTAVAVCIVGTMAGFMAGPTNLLTVGIFNTTLQNLGVLPADADVLAGVGLRLALWVVVTLISTLYICTYATRSRKDPARSLMAGVDVSDLQIDTSEAHKAKLTGRQIVVLLTIVGALIMSLIGMKYGFNGVLWTLDDVSAIFLVSGILSGVVAKMKASTIADALIAGAKGSIGGALVVGLARGVYWILNTSNVNATIIHSATELLRGTSPLVAAIGIVVIVSLINGLIPSGSGKGALLAPILAPIGLSLGLSNEVTVLAYQFGDGITNMFWFSYGTLLIFLDYGKVSINKWWKFFVPLMLIFFAVAVVFLYIALHLAG